MWPLPASGPGRVLVRLAGSGVVRALLAGFLSLGALIPGLVHAQPAAQTVQISSILNPANLTVALGTTVRWENRDTGRHRIRSTSGPAEFDGDLQPGESFSFTFTQSGTYQYRDDRVKELSNYWGTVTVGAVPPAPSAPAPGGTLPGGATPGPPAPAGPATAEVTMAGRVFAPRSVTVAQGATVTWRNNDGREHTVTERASAFDSGIMAAGAAFQKAFSSAGTFSYFCAIHPDMTGTVNVAGADGQAPSTAPAPTAPLASTPRPAAPAADVQAVDFGFTPTEFHAAVGATVTWANNGVALHTVTSRDGSFDSGMMTAGAVFARAFSAPGTYQYICSLHTNMAGSVVVGAVAGAPPPPVVTPPPRPPAARGSGNVRAFDFGFDPPLHSVAVGSTVTWVNDGVAPHTVTSRDGSFDSGTIKAGATYQRHFDAPGTFDYICGLHPDMTGTITVPDAQGGAPPPKPAPPSAAPARPAGATPPGTSEVDVVDSGYAPSQVSIPAGGTVRWVNTGVAPHTVTARDGSYDSGYLSRNDQFTRTFPAAGTYPYFCAIHPAMVGSVTVGGGGAGPASGAPAASGGGTATVPRAAVTPLERAAVEMRDFVYEPVRVLVRPGGTVTWKNTGVAPHTVDARDGSFSSGIKAQGESFSQKFETAGSFEYFCALHPNMIGTVQVTDRSEALPGGAGGASGGTDPGERGEAGGVPLLAVVIAALVALPLGAAIAYLLMRRDGHAGGTGPQAA